MHTAILALSGALVGLVLYTIYLVIVSHKAVTKAREKLAVAEENNELLLRKVLGLTLNKEELLKTLKDTQASMEELWAETTLKRKDYQACITSQMNQIWELQDQIHGLNGLIEMILTDIHPALVEFRQERAEERQPALFSIPGGA